MKVKILYKRSFEFDGRDGEKVSGTVYGGTNLDTGKGITFTSRDATREVGNEYSLNIVEGWNEEKARIKYFEAEQK